MTADRDGTLLGSVQRALALVDIVANSHRPTPVKALAQASGLTLGTTYNLVRTLVHEGYLRNEPDGLVLGRRFPGLRSNDERGVFLARVRTALRELSSDLEATAYLSRFQYGEVQLIDTVNAEHDLPVELLAGLNNSAHATALGKRILGELTEEDRLDYLARHPLEKFTENTISDRRILLQQLAKQTRASIDEEEYAIGYTCIAVPIRAPGVIASVAVSLPADRDAIDIEGTVNRMQAAASRLSLQLGADRLA